MACPVRPMPLPPFAPPLEAGSGEFIGEVLLTATYGPETQVRASWKHKSAQGI